MRKLIEKQPGIAIFAGAVLGFILPGLASAPKASVLAIIATVIYLACFNMTGLDFKTISVRSVLQFYFFRYLILPFLAFHVVSLFSRDLAIAVTLYCLLPSGVSSPALSNIYGGNVTLGLLLCFVTHLMTPILVPFICKETIGTLISIDTKALFVTLLITIVSPVILYFLTGRIKPVKSICNRYNKIVSVLLISSLGMFVIGMQRDMFLNNLTNIPILFLITSLSMYFLFVYAWLTEYQEFYRDRITFTIVSGFNNTALGVGIALLYFPSHTALFLIVSEIPWCIAPLIFSAFIKKKHLEAGIS